jgi:hypothetical protein
VTCSPFLEGVVANTKKMHQVLNSLLPPEHLRDVFSRIFLYLDQKIPLLYSSSATSSSKNLDVAQPSFKFPTTDKGKQRMIAEVHYVIKCLNDIPGVKPHKFTFPSTLKKQLGLIDSTDEMELERSTDDAGREEATDCENDAVNPEGCEDLNVLAENAIEKEEAIRPSEISNNGALFGGRQKCKDSDSDLESSTPSESSTMANGLLMKVHLNGQHSKLSEF